MFWLGLILSTHSSAGELLVFFDLDADSGSGCAVATSEGSFAGVEQILITRYADSMVTEVVRSECVDPPTDSFGPEQPVSVGGWPVGLNLGSGGSDLVETFVALADLGNFAPSVRIGFATRDAGGAAADAMLGVGGAGFELVLFTGEPAAIPSLQRLGLLLLALLLAGLSLYGIRRHPGVHSVVLMVSLAGSLVGLVWAAVTPDGDPSDWGAVSPLGTDATGDGGDDDLVAGFAMVAGNRLFLRGDLFWNQPPAIADQAFSIDENSANGTAVGTLAASDPDVGDTLGFAVTGGSGFTAFAVDPDTGEISVADSAQLDFETNPSLTLDVQVSDAAGLLDTALVTIDLNDIDDLPVAIPDSATVDEDAAATSIDVLTNDTDFGGAIAIASVTQPANGTVSITNAGADLTYQPDPDYCNDQTPASTDDFTYTLSPGGDTGLVTVTVTCVNDPPTVTPPADYASHAHIGISIPDGAADLLDGAAITDVDGPGAAPFSLGTTGAIVTANGGNATINTNGSFTYNPPTGFTGNDSFSYQICDSGVPAPSQCAAVTATVVVSGPRVWFVDSTAPGGGAGRLSDPFKTLAAADTAADANGDRIFVYTGVGTYIGGCTLVDSQRLVGQGVVDTDFDTALGIAPPANSLPRPAVNGARPTITGTIALAPDVRARGFNVSNTTDNGVTGSGASGLAIDQVSVTTTTGTAVNLANSGGTVSFTSISANGAVNGIVLNTTTGSFTITGDGTGAQNASGGTIQNTSGDGIVLTNTANIVINQIALNNAARHGISGIGVNNLTINDSTFDNAGDANDENTFEFRAGILSGAAAITGTLTLDNVDVTNFHDTGLLVYNESGTLTINVTNSNFLDNDDTDGVDAIFVEGEGTSSLAMTVTGGLCDNVEGDCVRFEAGGTGTNDVNVVGVRSTNGGGPDDFPNGGGIELIVDDGATLTFDIQGNDIRDVRGDPLIIASLISTGGGNLEGRVGGAGPTDGNTFSGSALGDGMQFTLEGGGTAATGRDFTILVQNNDIGVDNTGVGGPFNGLGDDGIQILHRDNSGMLNLTVEDNNIANTASEAIRFFSDEDTVLGVGNPATDFHTVGNTLSSIGDPQNLELRTSDTADACYHVSGNALPADINFSIAGTSTAEITQASLAVLSAANGGATITGDIPSFNGICTNPILPANP